MTTKRVLEERRKKRYPAHNLLFCNTDDMVIRDFSADGVGVWHFSPLPLRHDSPIKYNSMVYVIKWVAQVSANAYRYGCQFVIKEPSLPEKKSYISH